MPENAAIGTEVASISAPAPTAIFTCNSSLDSIGLKSANGDLPANGIIPFGNTGFGYKLNKVLTYPYEPSTTVDYFFPPPFTLKIYKTGPIKKSTSIPAGQFATYIAGQLTIFTASLDSELVVEAGSCELSTTDVNMGEYILSDFAGVSSTSRPVEFTVELRNCSGRIDKVKYDMIPGPGWLDQKNGIMMLDPGSVTGLGIQIRKDGQPVNFATDNELLPPIGASASYSFTASYYQTEREVGIGKANSSLTIQVSYL
ncbi:fimbrial protein [Pseudomonas taiwanensis]|uniref:fimbrial protein n=1 Tax=Pseudomonas taiwanensis TaxID=470150 RepID=UPI00138AE347|nr:fimbrial protein [Pseudomonas taiwanensis]